MIRKSSSHKKRKRAPITQPVLYHSTPHQATNIANGAFSPICDVSESHKIVPGLSSHTPDQEAQNRVCSSVSHEATQQTSKRLRSISLYQQAAASQLRQLTPLPTPPQSLFLPPDTLTAADHSTLHPSPSHIKLTHNAKKELDRLSKPISHCQR